MIITKIWRQQPGKYFCISTKNASGKWRDNFFKRSELDTVEEFIAKNQDKDIYFCPHGFSSDQRRKEYAVPPSLLWSDLDEADPRVIKIKPTVAIESSPGRFVGLWMIDEPMTEELNQRLSYSVGGDRSGWDLTQVLRFPGTRNYKYNSEPRVKLMWSDGPEYNVASLINRLPQTSRGVSAAPTHEAAELYRKYQKKFPLWLRRELLNGKPKAGKRSEMFWKISQTMIELGLEEDEVFVLLKASPWNKFSGRSSEDSQIRREIKKGISDHLNKPNVKDTDDEPDILVRSMDEVEEEVIEWIYYPYLARREVSIFEGDPGQGKSFLVQAICTALCDGKKLPSVRPMKLAKCKIVYFDIENDAERVTKRRLITLGLDNQGNFFQCEEVFSITDTDKMEQVIDMLEVIRPDAVVFDTINTYIGGADAFKGHEVHQVVGEFKQLARRFNCAVILIRHLTKSGKERAMYRGQGSISFAAVARIVVTVGTLPDDPDTKVMAMTKLNIAKFPKALTFQIKELPPTLKDQDRATLEFGDFVNLSSEDILSSPKSADKGNERDEAKKMLEGLLEEEDELEVDKLMKMAESRSIARRTLYRAAEELGLEKKLVGFGSKRRSVWKKALEKSQRPKSVKEKKSAEIVPFRRKNLHK